MNFIKTIGAFVLIAAYQFCLGQQEAAATTKPAPFEFSEFPRPTTAPHVVIEVMNQKSMELTEEESKKFVEDINSVHRGFQSIKVLSDQEAIEQYGIRGRNGVIIAKYLDVYKLPWDLQMKFIELK